MFAAQQLFFDFFAPRSTQSTPLANSPLAKGGWQHVPKINQIRLQGTAVSYELKRATRRTIGFSIRAEGLQVVAPKWCPLAEIESALHTKARWILRRLHEAKQQPPPMQWQFGQSIPYLGQATVLVCASATEAAIDWVAHKLPVASDLSTQVPSPATDQVPNQVLQPASNPISHREVLPQIALQLPTDASAQQIKDALHSYLQQRALGYLLPLLQSLHARLVELAPNAPACPTLRLSTAKSYWGLCQANGVIRLNWRLMHLNPAQINYVVAHELAHLMEMNHSPRFWQWVHQLDADYAAQRSAVAAIRLSQFD